MTKLLGENRRWTIFFGACLGFSFLSVGLAQGSHATAVKHVAAEPALPSLWVSQTTHAVYRLRITHGMLHAEQANTPPEAARHGAYVHTEAHPVGNKWVGTSALYAKITEAKAGSHESQWCHLTGAIEFFTLTPERITGRAQAPERMDISKCQVLKSEWRNFEWLPEK